MLMLALPLAVPLLLVAGWFTVLRWRGVPSWAFFACGVALAVSCVVAGMVAGDAEDRGLPSGCRDGSMAGLVCGYGVARGAGYLAAVTGTATLMVLAVISLIVLLVRRSSYRGLTARTRDE